jgi:hypothetical protein
MSIGVLTTVDTCHYRPTVLVIDCDNVTDMGFVPVGVSHPNLALELIVIPASDPCLSVCICG